MKAVYAQHSAGPRANPRRARTSAARERQGHRQRCNRRARTRNRRNRRVERGRAPRANDKATAEDASDELCALSTRGAAQNNRRNRRVERGRAPRANDKATTEVASDELCAAHTARHVRRAYLFGQQTRIAIRRKRNNHGRSQTSRHRETKTTNPNASNFARRRHAWLSYTFLSLQLSASETCAKTRATYNLRRDRGAAFAFRP